MFTENFISLTDYAVKAFESSSFDSYEISCVDRLHALTRFANSTIHQNVSDHTYRFLFKASKGKKLCTLSLTSLTKRSIDSAVSQIESMLSFIPEIPFYQGFSEDTEVCVTFSYDISLCNEKIISNETLNNSDNALIEKIIRKTYPK